ncbi:MFS transporter [Gordonibacter sp.]|uniref:MFS transporter n=1 Tax=Gordonibacter sp. TaxID=1968902 RepID=UPI002FCA3918
MESKDTQGTSTQVIRNPFLEAPASKKTMTVVGIYIAVVGSIIQSATLSTLLPVAGREIGGLDYYSLASTLSGIISVVVMPLWGYLGAKNPAIKRPLFTVSLLIGAAVLFARALAPSMMAVVVPSTLYGFVSAGIFVLGYSMIRDMFDMKKAGMYLGICGTMMSIGMLAGPVLGGIIMDAASWRWVCHMIWPFMLIGGLLVFFGAKATTEEAAGMASGVGKFDVSGSVAIIIFLGSLITALSLGTSFLPFGTMGSNALFALAAVGLVASVLVIRKKQGGAIIPATALKNRNTLSFAIANFFCMFSNMAVFFFLPMYVITVMQLPATEAGLTTTLYSVAGLFLSPLFGKMIGKAGNARGVLSFGCIMRIVVAGALLLVMAPDANIFVIYIIMLVAGCYNSVQSSAFSAGPQIQLPEDIRVQGNSIIQVGQNLGGAIGTAIYTVILGSMGIVGGMPIALAVSVAAAAGALVFALRLRKLED